MGDSEGMTWDEVKAYLDASEEHINQLRRDAQWADFFRNAYPGEHADEWRVYAEAQRDAGEDGAMDYQTWLDERCTALLAKYDTAQRIIAAVEAFAATLPDAEPRREDYTAGGSRQLTALAYWEARKVYEVGRELRRVMADARKGT